MTVPFWIFAVLWLVHLCFYVVFFASKAELANGYSKFMSDPFDMSEPAWAAVVCKLSAYSFVALIFAETFVF